MVLNQKVVMCRFLLLSTGGSIFEQTKNADLNLLMTIASVMYTTNLRT